MIRRRALPTTCVPTASKFGEPLKRLPARPEGTYRCSCGVATFPRPNGVGDDWVWVDGEGREFAFNSWHRHDGWHVEYPGGLPSVPWCHASPMRAAPGGWVCREAGGAFPYGDA